MTNRNDLEIGQTHLKLYNILYQRIQNLNREIESVKQISTDEYVVITKDTNIRFFIENGEVKNQIVAKISSYEKEYPASSIFDIFKKDNCHLELKKAEFISKQDLDVILKANLIPISYCCWDEEIRKFGERSYGCLYIVAFYNDYPCFVYSYLCDSINMY